MTIEYLCRMPEYVETVSRWIYEAFVVDTPRTATYEKIVENFSHTLSDGLPMTFIAMAGNKPAGMVSLVQNDLKTQEALTPWLAGLYVDPPFRGHGIAPKLIERVCYAAKRLGYGILYLRTEHTAEYYKKHGWTFLYRTRDAYNIETDVFKHLL